MRFIKLFTVTVVFFMAFTAVAVTGEIGLAAAVDVTVAVAVAVALAVKIT